MLKRLFLVIPPHFFTLMISAIFILSACTTTKKDGPPNFYVDESKITDATPKAEPLSKYGNMRTYSVFGKQYNVMSNCQNYVERGIASWYGSKFHAQRTSSGERYNMLAMTAAHKTLPLPTYVQVTNLKNGKKVIVKVNDRGPFEANRIIDLSYVAAKKLGMLGHGTAYVEVKAILPGQSIRPLFAQKQHCNLPHIGHGIYIQVGAFSNHHYALQMQQRIQNRISLPVSIVYANNLYRVKVGPFNDKENAFRINQQLKGMGIMTAHVTNYNGRVLLT